MSKPAGPKNPDSNAPKRGRPVKSSAGLLALVALVAVYSFVRPTINERTGLNLPALRVDSNGQLVEANEKPSITPASSDQAPKPSEPAPTVSSPASPSATSAEKSTAPANSTVRENSTARENSTVRENSTAAEKKPGPLSGRAPKPAPSPTEKPPTNDPNLKYGLLREIGDQRFVSPAGLLYTRGSAEGHRIEHVRRHVEDDPGRPGSHGVFDGGIEGALKTIDQAYEKAKQGVRTTKSEDDGRVIYTVDMGRRVGYVGGRDGGRKRNPMARRVRIVLEGTRVITAYPM